MTTLIEIRAAVADRYAETSLMKSGETYYPAAWVFGGNVGDAMTSDHADTRLSRAAQRAARDFDLNMDASEFDDCTRQRDAAAVIARRLRDRDDCDAAEDAHENEDVQPCAAELRAIREQLGLTQEALAEKLGLTGNTIARQERGEVAISEPVIRLARMIANRPMRMCNVCGRLAPGPRPGGGGVKDCCESNPIARAEPEACRGHLRQAEFVDGHWQIRRHV